MLPDVAGIHDYKCVAETKMSCYFCGEGEVVGRKHHGHCTCSRCGPAARAVDNQAAKFPTSEAHYAGMRANRPEDYKERVLKMMRGEGGRNAARQNIANECKD